MKLWELLHSVPLTGETPELDMEINSISYDTRTLEPGALFAALPGARDDGARPPSSAGSARRRMGPGW